MRLTGTCRADGSAIVQGIGRVGVAAVLAALVLVPIHPAAAQGSRTRPPTTRVSYTPEQQRGLMDDLTNGFMDDFNNRRIPAGANPDRGTPTDEIRALRPLIREFSDEATQLGFDLNDEVRKLPQIRQLYTESIKLSAYAVSLDKQVSRVNDHQLVMPDIEKLDATWRELAYRLGNVRGISRVVAERIGSLNQISDDIDNSVAIAPQLNRRDLYDKTYELAQDLRNLGEDVQVELGNREAQPFVLAINRARQQVVSISQMLEDNRVGNDQVVDEYKQFQTVWYPERAKLQEYQNRYFERSLRRITQTDGEIHQLLLLPTRVDTQQLLYLTSALQKDIDEFFERTSLKLLMHMPRADRVAGVASEFYGVCEHFIDEVNGNAKHDQLVDSFRYIEDAQRSFSDVFYDIDSDEALASLHQIELTIEALSASLQVERDDFDRRHAIDLTSQVESEIDQLDWAAKRWFTRDRQSFSDQCLREIASMRQQTDALNQELVRGATAEQLRGRTEQLYNTWRTVYNYLVKCQTEDRPTLGRISSRLTPTLVELRTAMTH
jgi:hypothetical protein